MLKFTAEHEWLKIEGDVATVGITTHAAGQLGDLVFVELPEEGASFKKDASAATVESVKAASDVYCPLDGEVVEINQAIVDDPSLVNSDPEGAAWFFKLKLANPSDADALLDEAALRTFHFLSTAPEFGENLLLGGGLTGALLAGLRVFAQAMSTQAGRGRHGGGPRWIRPAINTIGVALLILVAFFWALVAVAYLYPVSSAPAALMHWQSILEPRVLPTLLALGLLNWIANKDLDVLNLSSLHQFYAARLTRAYLGAGNLKRGVPWSTRPAASPDLKRVDEVVPGDDMLWADYQPHKNGGPLHLVNVTVNQTQFIADSDFQPDRKGWNLGVGPAGFRTQRLALAWLEPLRTDPPGHLDRGLRSGLLDRCRRTNRPGILRPARAAGRQAGLLVARGRQPAPAQRPEPAQGTLGRGHGPV